MYWQSRHSCRLPSQTNKLQTNYKTPKLYRKIPKNENFLIHKYITRYTLISPYHYHTISLTSLESMVVQRRCAFNWLDKRGVWRVFIALCAGTARGSGGWCVQLRNAVLPYWTRLHLGVTRLSCKVNVDQ